MIVARPTLTMAASLIRTITRAILIPVLELSADITQTHGLPIKQDMKTMKRQATSNIRNHVAKALWTPKFRPQVAKDPKVYTRKEKHKVKYA